MVRALGATNFEEECLFFLAEVERLTEDISEEDRHWQSFAQDELIDEVDWNGSAELKSDREVMLAAILRDGIFLACCGEALRDDRDLVLEAVRGECMALQFASQRLRSEKEVVVEALERQLVAPSPSRPCLGDCSGNLLQLGGSEPQADSKVVLLAIRHNGLGLRYASHELREDKDFVLKAVRVTPTPEKWQCYEQASRCVKSSVSWEDCHGAASSLIALPGDEAPVLSVAAKEEPVGGADQAARSLECSVALMSGASFHCSWPSSMATTLSVAQFVEHLLKEWPHHLQASVPERVFVVFGQEFGVGTSVTPWDWCRSLSEFLGPS